MKGKIFAIRKKFKGVITIVIDVPIESYVNLDPLKEVEITQEKEGG